MALTKAAEPAYGIARLIGEGYGKPDGTDETPIDIQYAKIAEWLVLRPVTIAELITLNS